MHIGSGSLISTFEGDHIMRSSQNDQVEYCLPYLPTRSSKHVHAMLIAASCNEQR